jgi:hypothetical protein
MARKLIWLGAMFCLLMAGSSPADEFVEGYDACMDLVVGQHFSGSISAPTFFPALELRGGYRVSDNYTVRLGLSAAYAQVTGSARSTFNDAHLMVGDLSIGFLFTPSLGEEFRLLLGARLGLWMSSMWGDALVGGTGSEVDYLETLSVNYGLVAGGEWALSRAWALVGEVRLSVAMVPWAGAEYNTGGVTVLAGFTYRFMREGP